MSQYDNEIDERKKHEKYFDFRVWKQTENLKNENIIGKTVRNQNNIKEYAEILILQNRRPKIKK